MDCPNALPQVAVRQTLLPTMVRWLPHNTGYFLILFYTTALVINLMGCIWCVTSIVLNPSSYVGVQAATVALQLYCSQCSMLITSQQYLLKAILLPRCCTLTGGWFCNRYHISITGLGVARYAPSHTCTIAQRTAVEAVLNCRYLTARIERGNSDHATWLDSVGARQHVCSTQRLFSTISCLHPAPHVTTVATFARDGLLQICSLDAFKC
jgi:hypothetical protein